MDNLDIFRNVIDLEVRALQLLLENIDDNFVDIGDTILNCKGKIIFTGIGKSGIVASKIASTFNTVGKPSIFIHPVEFLHGEMGVIHRNDILFVISRSGETDELLSVMNHLKESNIVDIPFIGIVGDLESSIGKILDKKVKMYMVREADEYNTLPTSSAIITMAIGDALCVYIQKKMDLDSKQLESFHPNGDSGRILRNAFKT